MDILDMYATVRRNWNGEIEYRNFLTDCWVSSEEFDLNCTTNTWVAESFVNGNGGEVVKLKINVTEEK